MKMEMNEKIYCIGDTHGCYNTLLALVDRLPKDATLIFLGDLCDKGNFTKEVVSFIKDNNHIAIKGNHDYMMEQYLKDSVIKDKTNLWTSNAWGGYKTVNSYRNNLDLIKEHIDFISELPLYIEIDRYFLTHGFGLPYYQRRNDVTKQLMSNRLERRFPDWEDFSNYDVINIYGHCDYNKVMYGDKYIGIDTGCVYGRKLTAINLFTNKITQEDVHFKDIE